ncbi:MAG TPA: glycoside hydrolase family 44 protein [Polyangiaceae bacterium]|nr:glycoside hydrolase family 44 protein [Polyangiaceae bacterium]
MRRFGGLSAIAFALVPAAAHCGGGGSSNGNSPQQGPGGSSGGDGGTGMAQSPEGTSGQGDDGAASEPPGTDAAANLDAWTAPDVGTPVEAGSPGMVDITMEVQANQGAHAISPYVYGVNNGGVAAAHHATIVRNGGNRITAFNWENNASNAGSDYQFENDDFLCANATCKPSNDAPGAYLKFIVDQATTAGAAALLTVPIVDYVSADKSPGGDVRNSGSNYLQTRFKQNKVKGSGLQNPPDTTDGTVYQDEMVNWVSQTEPHATVLYMLDNEPDLWSSTHAEVHPNAVTYAELAQRNIEFAKAVKTVTPAAQVWGPVSYGWTGYLNLQNAPDAKANGDFLSWWLAQMAAAAKAWGKPVVDGMDLHWYSEVGDGGAKNPGNGGAPGTDCRINSDPKTNTSMAADCYTASGQAGMAAEREQATRSLWDATYVENSWIASSIGNKPLALIPSMQKKIATSAPSMKLAFSEYNYGGGSDISGTIATADVLGIFGSYGVGMAMLWETWHDESFSYAAFDAYRNYDGHGAAFGDTSITATTSDVPNSSVYASLSSADASRLVIVAINKATQSKVAGIQIAHSTVYSKASVYVFTQSGGAKPVAGTALTSVATNAFRYTMPAQSVTVIVPSP